MRIPWAIDDTFELAFNRALLFNLNINFRISFNIPNVLSRNFDSVFNPAFEQVSDQAIDNALNRIHVQTRTYNPVLNLDRIINQEQHSISLSSNVLQRPRVSPWKWMRQILFDSTMESESVQAQRDRYITSYLALAVLRERLQGHLSAHEGILLMRERRKFSSDFFGPRYR